MKIPEKNRHPCKRKTKYFLSQNTYSMHMADRPKKEKHHTIPMQIVLIPGLMLLFSLLLFILGQKDLSYLIVGMAIVVAILIHREDYKE